MIVHAHLLFDVSEMAGFRENNYNSLSDSAVKEKWTKDSHCHFCRRRCDSQEELKHHLEEENQEQCKECYFRHYKTKVSNKTSNFFLAT